MLPALHFPKFQMARNTWVPILNICPILGIFSWVLPLYIHARLPGTLKELFSSQHNCFSCLQQPSNFVAPISLLVPYLLTIQVLTLTYQLDCSKKLEYYICVHTQFQKDSYMLILENYYCKQIILRLSSLPTYLVCPLHTFLACHLGLGLPFQSVHAFADDMRY